MKTKVAIFDFDGTLTSTKKGGNCWQYIWEEIGKSELDDMYYRQYLAGEFDYRGWVERVLNVYRENGVNREFIARLANRMIIRDGLKDTFKFLSEQGVKIYILSGGVKSMINAALKDVLPFITKIEAEDFTFDEKGLLNGVIILDHDIENKKEYISRLRKQYKLKDGEVFFVGNGKNDETAHEAGAITLCINADGTDPLDKQIWDYHIDDIKNMKEILTFIK